MRGSSSIDSRQNAPAPGGPAPEIPYETAPLMFSLSFILFTLKMRFYTRAHHRRHNFGALPSHAGTGDLLWFGSGLASTCLCHQRPRQEPSCVTRLRTRLHLTVKWRGMCDSCQCGGPGSDCASLMIGRTCRARHHRLECRHHSDVARYDENVPIRDWHDGYMVWYDKCAWYEVRHDRYVTRYDGFTSRNDRYVGYATRYNQYVTLVVTLCDY